MREVREAIRIITNAARFVWTTEILQAAGMQVLVWARRVAVWAIAHPLAIVCGLLTGAITGMADTPTTRSIFQALGLPIFWWYFICVGFGVLAGSGVRFRSPFQD